jgi:hypothetical protein
MSIRLKPMLAAIVATAILAPASLLAHDDAVKEQSLSDHPAVIIFKKWTQSDYVSKSAIYPHPAEIWWYMHDPKTADQPLPKKSVD